ncbi:MAG: hypothetical protein OQK03_09645, partial [Colwellia sp.]|nr:hypothetical protein [Colwellia sp.]
MKTQFYKSSIIIKACFLTLIISLFSCQDRQSNVTDTRLVATEEQPAKRHSNSYSGEQLRYIGMPVGGITSGQVYLGGDGQLWYWDIFNIKRLDPGGGGDKFYLNPLVQDKRFEQGFAVRVNKLPPSDLRSIVRPLRNDGFKHIEFKGE